MLKYELSMLSIANLEQMEGLKKPCKLDAQKLST
jgi:hypothetical protein